MSSEELVQAQAIINYLFMEQFKDEYCSGIDLTKELL